MKSTTKKRAGAVLALVIGALLVVMMSGCSTQPSWELSNLSDKGKVEAVVCDQVDSASEQLEDAVTDEDSGALATIGVWVNNKLDDAALKDVRERIKQRRKQCDTVTTTVTSSGLPTATTTASSVPSDGNAGVRDSNGALRTVPLVGRDGEGVAPVDTTEDPRSPATLGVLLKCKQAKSWHDLVVCVGNDQTYKDAVTARKPQTGFDWDDILRWEKESIDARVIQVFNLNISDTEARDRVRGLVGSDADRLPIARHGCAMNTRRLEDNSISDFTDCRPMVRVSLAPLVYTGDKVTGMLADRGIFVDCFNLWWIPQAIVRNGPPPQPGNPGTPGTGGGTPPGTTVPPAPPGTTTVPPTTNPPVTPNPKIPGQAPPHDGGHGTITGPASTPTGGQPVPTYTTQAPPAPVTTVPGGTPAPPVTTQVPTATGAAPSTAPGGSTGCAPGDSGC